MAHRPVDEAAPAVGAISEDPDSAAVAADDALLDLLGDPDHTPSDGDVPCALAAQRREVHTDSDRELIDTDTARAALHRGRGGDGLPPIEVEGPFVAAVVALLAMILVIGAAVSAVYLLAGRAVAILAALVLVVVWVALALGVVVRRRRS